MPRVRKGAARRRQHKKILKSTRGYIGAASRRYRVAREAWLRAGQYATIGRKLRKRDFRRLWITRISAACQQRGTVYSRFIHALSTHGIRINRKVLADMAVSDPAAFDELVAIAFDQKPARAAAEVAAEPAAKEAKEAEERATAEVAVAEDAAGEAGEVKVERESPPSGEAAADKPRARKKSARKAKPKAEEAKAAEAPDKPKVKKKAAAKKAATKKAAARKSAAKGKSAGGKTAPAGGASAKKKSAAKTKKKSAAAKKPKKGEGSEG